MPYPALPHLPWWPNLPGGWSGWRCPTLQGPMAQSGVQNRWRVNRLLWKRNFIHKSHEKHLLQNARKVSIIHVTVLIHSHTAIASCIAIQKTCIENVEWVKSSSIAKVKLEKLWNVVTDYTDCKADVHSENVFMWREQYSISAVLRNSKSNVNHCFSWPPFVVKAAAVVLNMVRRCHLCQASLSTAGPADPGGASAHVWEALNCFRLKLWLTRPPKSTAVSTCSHQNCWESLGSCHTGPRL